MAPRKNQIVELGDLAKDIITGYEGVVISMVTHLTGCDRVGLQAQLKDKNKGGSIPDGYQFDITTVNVVKKRVAIPKEQYVTTAAAPRAIAPVTRPGGPFTKTERPNKL
jgi:hypothetical protein